MRDPVIHTARAEERVSGKTNPAAAIRRLRELVKDAQKNLFERVRLTAELIYNYDWVEERFQGKQRAAAHWLEQEFFAEIAGWIDAFDLANIYRMFPDEKRWLDCGCDLRMMHDLYQEANEQKRAQEQHTSPRKKPSSRSCRAAPSPPRENKQMNTGQQGLLGQPSEFPPLQSVSHPRVEVGAEPAQSLSPDATDSSAPSPEDEQQEFLRQMKGSLEEATAHLRTENARLRSEIARLKAKLAERKEKEHARS